MIWAASCLITSSTSLFFFVNIETLLSFLIIRSRSHNSPLTIETKASEAKFFEILVAICIGVIGLSYSIVSLFGRVIINIILYSNLI